MAKAAKEAGAFQRDFSLEEEKKDLETIRSGGTKVNIVTDLSAFQKAVQPVYEAFQDDYAAMIAKIRAAQKK
jgi:TRAP-type C4-dicarboxylate transport system substrate-binding protein